LTGRIVFALVLLAAGAVAATPDYFPLLEGNQWIYRQTGIGAGEPFTVEVVRREVFAERVYFLVSGFPGGDQWLRRDAEGTLLTHDHQEERDRVWVAFGVPEGSAFVTEVTGCNDKAVLVSRNAEFQGLLGSFTWATQIDYLPGKCADAGVQREYFLPWVGLIERTVNTIAGPRSFELIYARLSGVTFVSEPGVSVSLTLSLEAETLRGRLTLRNHFVPPFKLTFNSGQRFDLVLRNSRDDIVYQWSEGKSFTEAIEWVEFGHGEQNYVVETPLVDRGGMPLPAGDYRAEAWLTNSEGGGFRAMAGFRID
jgi:intracellular proteinase inhibitor BsuPI